MAITWSPQTGWQGITPEDRKLWSEAYPACNVNRQLAAMDDWLRSNPKKAVKKQWRRFISNWLSRQQDRGGDTGSQGGGQHGKRDLLG